MKKIIMIMFMFLAIFSFLFAVVNVGYEYEADILYGSMQKLPNQRFMIQYSESADLENATAQDLMILAKKHHVSLAKFEKSTTNHIRDMFLYTEDCQYFKQIGLSFQKKEWQRFYENELPISNQYQEKAYAYFPRFPSQSIIRYYPYTNHENIDLEGDYIVSGNHVQDFLADLQKQYPQLNLMMIGALEDLDSDTFKDVLLPEYQKVMVFLGVILFVFLFLYFDKKKRRYMIEKMHGYSTIKILFKENRWLWSSMILIDLLIYGILFGVRINALHPYAYKLLQYLAAFLILNLIMITVIIGCFYFYMKMISYTEILRKKSNLKKAVILHFLIRSIVFAYGITLLYENVPMLVNEAKYMVQKEGYIDAVKEYQTVQYIEHTVKQEDSFKQSFVIAEGLQKQGAIGADMHASLEHDLEFIPYLEVNPNYLRKYPILDDQEQPVSVDKAEVDQMPLVLIPCSFYDDFNLMEKIEEQFPKQYYQYAAIKDHQTYFTFNKEIMGPKLGYVKGSIVVVSGYINTDSLYIEKVNITELNQYIKDNGMPEGIGFYSVKERDASFFNLIQAEMEKRAFLMIFDVIALFVLTLHLLTIFQNEQKKKMALKNMYGYSMMRSYEDLILLLACFYLGLCSWLWIRVKEADILLYVTGYLLLELFVVWGNHKWIHYQAKWNQWFKE